jgi:ATP-dependent protease ClpP protease subunit
MLSGDHYAREYLFTGAIGPKSVGYCLDQLTLWHRIDEKELGDADDYRPMHIIMCSEGGEVISGFHLFDQILAYSKRGGGKHKITMTVRGYAASMAGILLQAADRRVMGPSAHLLVHEVSSWAEGSMGALKDKMKWLDMMSDQVVDLYIKRADGKIDKDRFISKWSRTDWWMSASQALELGFVDEIG